MTETDRPNQEHDPVETGNTSEIPNPDAPPEVPEECRPVLAALELGGKESGSWVKTLLLLGISLIIFFNLGLLNNGLSDMLILVLVIIIHEAGHFAGMKWFGYRDIKMFFIPFFGAAVSGKSINVSMAKKAIIALLGPVPGLVAGTVFSCLYLRTQDHLYEQFAVMFILINAFNLLPIYPLDGGRFFHEILFSRHPAMQAISRVLASLTLIGLGCMLKFYLLTILGVLMLLNFASLRTPFRIRRIARELKPAVPQEFSVGGGASPEGAVAEKVSGIPTDIAVKIIQKVRGVFPSKLPPIWLADYTRQVWEKITLRPPGFLTTLGFMGVYFVVLVVPMFFLCVLMYESNTESRIVKYEKTDGTYGQKEQFVSWGQIIEEYEVDPSRNLYHGRQVLYHYNGKIDQEAVWSDGRLDGECKIYDESGNLAQEIMYVKGKAVSYRVMEKGACVTRSLDSIPFLTRMTTIGHDSESPKGPEPLKLLTP